MKIMTTKDETKRRYHRYTRSNRPDKRKMIGEEGLKNTRIRHRPVTFRTGRRA